MSKKSLLSIVSLLSLVIACGNQSPKNTEQTENDNLNAAELAFSEQSPLKIIEPTIGETPDISIDAAKNLQRLKKLYETIDSLIQSYPDYETAKEHLTPRQIEIYENEEEYSREDHLDVSIWGCSWYCGGGPDSIFASSELKPVNNLNYFADNAHDFSLRTAWVEGVKGYGIGESITYRFQKQSPPVTNVEIFNGYMKSDKTWQDNSRVKQLKLYVNGNPYAILNLQDIKSRQIFRIAEDPGLGKTDKDLYLKFEIMTVYKGDKYDDVAISEIEFYGTGVHCFAKGTMVATPDGEKPIEQLKIGDQVLSLNTTTTDIETATVLQLANRKHFLYELDFDNTKIKVTDDHPFYFDGKYYSIIENDKYGVKTNLLSVGQRLHYLSSGKITVIQLRTITKLDKNNLFFANVITVATE
jgi:hypothetical protein